MLVLIRHGQTVSNAERKLPTRVIDDNSMLTALGHEQAREAGLELADIEFDHVYCSSMQRAMDTCQHILDANKRTKSDRVSYLYEIRERSAGHLVGMTNAQAVESFPRRKWLEWERDYYVAPPGGESYAQVGDRVIPVLKAIIPLVREGKNVLVVSHAGVMKVLIGHLRGLEESEICSLWIENAIPYTFNQNFFDAQA